jgi:asparagine synthase (glutamine-hydrolysing)
MAVKKNLLPREIVFRKKQGFGAPIHTWMGRDWKEVSEQVLDPVLSSNYTGLFNSESVRKMLSDPYVNSNRMFALMVFVLWYRMYVEKDKLILPPQGMNALV